MYQSKATTSQARQIPNMVSRLQNLHSLYAQLTLDYSRLSLANRRYLYGSHTQTTPEVRMLAQAKFVLAATMQWCPSSWGYDANGFVAATGMLQKKSNGGVDEADDELCPIWGDFFKEMVAVDGLLASRAEGNVLSSEEVAHAELLLGAAEEKYAWILSLFQAVSQQGHWVPTPGGVQLTDAMIFAGWNRFCMSVASGMSLEHALGAIRAAKAIGTDSTAIHAGKSCQREFFFFTQPVDYKPWVLPALTTSEYHPGCATDSYCRRSAAFRLCKARGQERDNSNCSQSGGWNWPYQSKDTSVIRYETPSYPAACHSLEEALEAD